MIKKLQGFSRSCISSSFYWPEEKILLDCGPFASLYGAEAKDIFISHYHTDHVNGILNLLYIKFCRNIFDKINIYAPPGTCDYVNKIIAQYNDSNHLHFSPEIQIIPVGEEKIKLSSNIYVYPLKTFHRCESLGFAFIKGKDILLAYTSDTGSPVLENPCLEEARFLMIESTYLEEEYIERARLRGHIALPELDKFISRFKGEKIYLTHFLESYKRRDIYNAIKNMKFNFLLEPAGLTLDNIF